MSMGTFCTKYLYSVIILKTYPGDGRQLRSALGWQDTLVSLLRTQKQARLISTVNSGKLRPAPTERQFSPNSPKVFSGTSQNRPSYMTAVSSPCSRSDVTSANSPLQIHGHRTDWRTKTKQGFVGKKVSTILSLSLSLSLYVYTFSILLYIKYCF